MTAPTPDSPGGLPGRIMAWEMAEQPAVLRRIPETGAPRIQEVARRVAARGRSAARTRPRPVRPGPRDR